MLGQRRAQRGQADRRPVELAVGWLGGDQLTQALYKTCRQVAADPPDHIARRPAHEQPRRRLATAVIDRQQAPRRVERMQRARVDLDQLGIGVIRDEFTSHVTRL